ncbi:titin-like [Ostrinia furnacalis]|uniref:titin-like n=1 Tax=Ostrinia furnacalis TaxID=93504 RepID=UPI00103B9D36|nr:titin-like [Ostrinia furnacalis]
MELDVHLKREGDESWGFRLVGGKDSKMPLTVVKVAPDSPASRAGLQNGDVLCHVTGTDASEMSHDSAKQFVAEARDTLELGVKRGLYDPVLDDYEPIYETIDQEDFDQPSQPTEVDPFKIQQFLDPKQPSREASELKDIEPGLTPLSNGLDLDQSRSLTASPFVLSTKPYRPFSTEPLLIPPLEDPIILNPNYKDQFGKLDDDDDEFRGLPETKFKLPISEQYDPDGIKKKKERASSEASKVKFAEVNLKEDVTVSESKFSKDLKQKTALEEKKYMEKMKKEIDLDKIEMTAVNLVNESIERAVSVTDEIKKEIDVELHESSITSSKIEQSSSVKESSKASIEMTASESSQVTKSVKKSSKEASELVELIDQTTDEIISYNGSKSELKVSEEVKKIENLDKKEQVVDERRLSTKQEIEEIIESGSVRRKSEVFDKKVDVKSVETSQKKEQTKIVAEPKVVQKKVEINQTAQKTEQPKITQAQVSMSDAKDVQKKAVKAESINQSAQKTSAIKKEAITSQKSAQQSFDTKTSTAKRLAGQRAYAIGLQTIPNIKGTITSSYHYNLLLKTFFIHLTDVMVALSRFILSEPVFNKVEESQEVTESDVVTEKSVSEYKKEYVNEEVTINDRKEEKIMQTAVSEAKQEVMKHEKGEKVMAFEERVEKQAAIKSTVAKETAQVALVEERSYAEDIQANLEVEEIITKQKLSGAQMAQVQERKSAELAQKMDAVISEFQTKAGIEETEITKDRRSRSRSRVVEEIAKESDPLEWLSKVDQQHTKEITELKSESKSFSSTTESVEKKRVESTHERREKSTKSKEGKQMYVAIVESHIFTNKDAIFEEQAADFSETSSVQSVDEINIALQASESLATEKVALDSKEMKQEVAESIVAQSQELSVASAQTQLVQMSEEVVESKAIVEEAKAIEIKEEVQKVEVKEEKALEMREEIQQVKEETHNIMSVSEKTEVDISQRHESVEIQEIKQEEIAVSNIEESSAVEMAIVEEVSEVQTKEIEVAPIIEETVEIKLPLPAKPEPTLQEEAAALKIVKEEIIEREQVLKLAEESELNISKHTEISETASQYSEVHKSKMASYESSEMVQESSFTASLIDQKSQSTEVIQESSFTASLADQKSQLTLDLSNERKIKTTSSESSIPSIINTPTPSTVPPTPLTDEYVFKLQIPLPKNVGDPIPRDCTPTPEDEDPNIVKKKLIPYIDTTLESPVIYDPPLPSPPFSKPQSPVYTKPGLRGGADRRQYRKEEILEIERKSSLLASAIDETIKSIEEYKEEVGIETKKEITVTEDTKKEHTSKKSFEEHVSTTEVIKSTSDQPIIYNGYAKVETKVYNNANSKIDEEWKKIDEQVKESNENLVQLTNGFTEGTLSNGVDAASNGLTEETLSNGVEATSNGLTEETVANGVESKTETKVENRTLKATELNSLEAKQDLIQSENTAEISLTNSVKETMEDTAIVSDTTARKSSVDVAKFDIKPAEEVVTNGGNPGDVSAAFVIEQKRDPMEGYRPVQFNPEELIAAKKGLQSIHLSVQEPTFHRAQSPSYVSSSGEPLGTHQGIVDSLEEATVDEEVAKELGKPGMTEQKIAELISGESEMLREAHVMGLSRVLKSHMHRADDSSVDFKKIKPIIESLKDSEVLKALNDELIRTAEEKKKEEEKKWTTFLQKPKRPVPKAKFGYFGYIQEEEKIETPYKVKIVKQPKPKVAPDYKPENFETGPLPWEERALNEPPPPPVEPEDPILVPEEVPEFLEAVDPLPESEVPDLEETGIPLPPPKPEEESVPSPVPLEEPEDTEEPVELDVEAVVEETNQIVEDMEKNRLAEQLLMGVQNMVDPNASVEQQLAQMRAQMAALAQLPGVIQQTLDLVTRQLSQLTQQETQITAVSESQMHSEMQSESLESVEVTENNCETVQEESNIIKKEINQNGEQNGTTIEEVVEETKPSLTQEEMEKLRKEEEEMLEEQRRVEKQKKELMEQMRLEQESRQVKQRPTPRVGKPKPVFGNPEPQARPLVLPGGRRWRKPADAYNEAFIAETLSAQAEMIQGKTKGINFMKYEKPPVSLDHLQHSDVYKLIHNMEQEPPKRVEMRTPVIAEADYREKCRSVTPCGLAIL